jgi:osmoprotectant transport system ATP-binding protein
LIKLVELFKEYPGQKVPAVNGITLEVEAGEICVFVGPSGCGKSTTLRLINRLIEPTSGTVYVNGENIMDKNPDELRQNIGYVIQQIGLLPHKTIAENVSIVPRLLKWPKEKINDRVEELLNLVGLDADEVRDRYPYQLSGGMMQRVGVARAMAVNPPIMLMDEPFGAVDPLVRSYLQDEFLRIQMEVKKTICFVTHSINEAIKMGDKIAIMNEGKIVQFGTPEEILSNPADSFVAEFVGEDRGVKMLYMTKCNALMGECSGEFIEQHNQGKLPSIKPFEPLNNALAAMLENDTDVIGIMENDQLIGMLTWQELKEHVSRMVGASDG